MKTLRNMKTAQEWIAAFDRGEVIESVSMGGMGDGYESAIQSCAVEIVRRLCPHTVPKEREQFTKLVNLSESEAVALLDATHGFSGAQVGAAKNLSAIIWRRGLDSFKEVSDRIIKIRKDSGNPKLAIIV